MARAMPFLLGLPEVERGTTRQCCGLGAGRIEAHRLFRDAVGRQAAGEDLAAQSDQRRARPKALVEHLGASPSQHGVGSGLHQGRVRSLEAEDGLLSVSDPERPRRPVRQGQDHLELNGRGVLEFVHQQQIQPSFEQLRRGGQGQRLCGSGEHVGELEQSLRGLERPEGLLDLGGQAKGGLDGLGELPVEAGVGQVASELAAQGIDHFGHRGRRPVSAQRPGQVRPGGHQTSVQGSDQAAGPVEPAVIDGSATATIESCLGARFYSAHAGPEGLIALLFGTLGRIEQRHHACDALPCALCQGLGREAVLP